jgi:uncharacterized protein YegP (UPF0339 family)
MSGPRFLFLATAGDSPGPRGAPQPEFLWRLVAGNNHVLGRSPSMYRELEACRAAITRLVEGISRAEPAPSAASRPGCWSWELVLPAEATRGAPGGGSGAPAVTGGLLAVAARRYERQRECRYSLENFVAAVPVAVVVDKVAVRPARLLLRSDLALLPAVISVQAGDSAGLATRP